MRAFSIALGRGNCYYISYRRLVRLHAMAHRPGMCALWPKPPRPWPLRFAQLSPSRRLRPVLPLVFDTQVRVISRCVSTSTGSRDTRYGMCTWLAAVVAAGDARASSHLAASSCPHPPLAARSSQLDPCASQLTPLAHLTSQLLQPCNPCNHINRCEARAVVHPPRGLRGPAVVLGQRQRRMGLRPARACARGGAAAPRAALDQVRTGCCTGC